jgi:NAD(P)-dependent dehydrogenase (short-subunit alcohol dehydrogenase family)
MSDSAKRVALVTGGSRGIGLGIARALAAIGFDLAINGRRADADVGGALTELRRTGADTIYCQADVGELADHDRLVDAIWSHFGRLDVLVNNAGVAPEVRADVLDATPESFDRLININLRGPYFLTQRVARWLIDQRQANASFYGAIINVSSVSAVMASINRGDYCISKAGVAMATKVWAARLGEFGIPVYEVRPGIIRTDMTAAVTEKYDAMIAAGAFVESRWGEPEDIGRAVAMLADGGLTYATSTVLTIDGGLTLERL